MTRRAVPLPCVLVAAVVLGAALLSGCAGKPAEPEPGRGVRVNVVPSDAHTPDFARLAYEPFARESVVGIALREWRLFGQPIHDEPPGSLPLPAPDEKPERWPGLWQRVGEYWWGGVDPNDREAAWTGKHNANGAEFPAGQDGRFAWSAAFISYVMRIAGAGTRFPYSASHSDYINAAREASPGLPASYVVAAERPEVYAPRAGDLICEGRGRAGSLRFDDLPAGHFPAHCDIVVQVDPGQLSVIGGNVGDAVSMKHVPVTPDGKLATPDGTIIDTRYAWMVVLRVLYDGPMS